MSAVTGPVTLPSLVLTPEIRLDPFDMYAQAREAGLVYLADPGVWNVFRYADVRAVLRDHTRFSSDVHGGASILGTDPPRHGPLRALVGRAFLPSTLEALRPRIEAIARELLDATFGRAEMDVVRDFAGPLPVMVIAELLGIPAADRARFKVWSDMVVASADPVLLGQAAVLPPGHDQAMDEMAGYLAAAAAERRAAPRDDLISMLVAAEIDGAGLSEGEIVDFCWLLLVAGNVTTTHLITNAVRCLLDHPEAGVGLAGDPERLAAAVEEVLRFRSPIQSMFRRTRCDVEIAGHTIPAGQMVIAWIGAANRDPEQFPAADRFDPRRSPNPHLAFGHGIHFCLGAPLARLEAQIALAALLARLPDLRRADDRPLVPAEGFIVHGVQGLTLRV